MKEIAVWKSSSQTRMQVASGREAGGKMVAD